MDAIIHTKPQQQIKHVVQLNLFRIKRKDAASLGRQTYFSHKPCAKGHHERYTSSGNCVKCQSKKSIRLQAKKIKDKNGVVTSIKTLRRRKNVVGELLGHAKRRAKEKKLDFNLLKTDLSVPEYCPVFPWIKLGEICNGPRSDSTPTLDRIDNSQGYIRGNVRIISWRANNLKHDVSLDEIRRLYLYISGGGD